jgi:hypothetical protein
MSRSRQERINLTNRKVQKRKRMLSDFGERGGLIYEKHIEKVKKSPNYMRDGNVTHYVACGQGDKTRQRGRYGKVLSYSHRDEKSLLKGLGE